jgi:hypothetical protein
MTTKPSPIPHETRATYHTQEKAQGIQERRVPGARKLKPPKKVARKFTAGYLREVIKQMI